MRIGIDLGGTKTEAIIIGENSSQIWRRRIATVRGNYFATLNDLQSLVLEAEEAVGKRNLPVGIGIPGTVAKKTGLVKNANSIWLIGKAFQHDISERLGRYVKVANDANCFALSEAADGAGLGFESVFGVILGTGVGGGLIFRDRIQEGVNSIGGEWGHNSLPWPEAEELSGPTCYCGLKGCLETFLSGPGLIYDHKRVSSEELSTFEIIEKSRAGDLHCLATLDRYYSRLARGLAMIINIVDPHAIVLGGGMSNIAEVYEEVPRRWKQWIFSDTIDTALVPALHGDSSGVRGAAWLNSTN